MGTVVSLHARPHSAAGIGRIEKLLADACLSLHAADAVFSTWKEESALSRVRRGELAVEEAPAELAEVLDLCRAARNLSAGWFDPWQMPGGVDPTGLVKGWAAERALESLRAPEIAGASVNAGGDMAVLGAPADGSHWEVGVRHPWRSDAVACVVRVHAAIATSGNYERGDHLVDPYTGCHQARAASATVVGPSLAFADALATALAVGADDTLRAIEAAPGYEGYLIRPDATEAWSEGMPFAD